jgi:hypothetical protein
MEVKIRMKPIKGTRVYFPTGDWESKERFMRIEQEIRDLLGPPGVQPDRRWYKRSVSRYETEVARFITGNPMHLNSAVVTKSSIKFYTACYFRNAADATMIQLKFR